MSDLADRLRDYRERFIFQGGSEFALKVADALDAQAKEIEALRAELDLRRKSGSATDRLHNLCESIAADADGSEFSREEWDRIDAENAALRAEVEAVQDAMDRAADLIASAMPFCMTAALEALTEAHNVLAGTHAAMAAQDPRR